MITKSVNSVGNVPIQGFNLNFQTIYLDTTYVLTYNSIQHSRARPPPPQCYTTSQTATSAVSVPTAPKSERHRAPAPWHRCQATRIALHLSHDLCQQQTACWSLDHRCPRNTHETLERHFPGSSQAATA
jgi:hypothetical protein